MSANILPGSSAVERAPVKRVVAGSIPARAAIQPKVPVVYEEAVTALAACLSIDDAKQWDNKADALAAWAKIYRDGKVQRQAKALKLLSYRRMGELAAILRPHKKGGGCGSLPGPKSLLLEYGMSRNQAMAATRLARWPIRKMQRAVDAQVPLAPLTLVQKDIAQRQAGTDAWRIFIRRNGARHGLRLIIGEPARVSAGMSPDERAVSAKEVQQLSDWCDEFLQHCEKVKP